MSRLWRLFGNGKTLVLALVTFVLPWQTRSIFGGVEIGNQISEFLTFSVYAVELILLISIVVQMRLWRFREHRNLVIAALVALFAIASSAFVADAWNITWHALMHIAFAVMFFVALLDDDVKIKPIIMSFAAGLMVPVVLGTFQVITGASGSSTLLGLASRDAQRLGDAIVMIDGERVLRAYGSFPHPNMFGGYLALAAVGVSMLKFQWRRAVMTVVALGLIATGSRSALIGVALAASAVVVMRRWGSRAAVAAISCVLLVGMASVVFAPRLIASIRGGGVTELRSVVERAEQYATYPEVIRNEHLLLGIGPGTYVEELSTTEPGKSVWAYQPIHNAILLMLAELGLLGGGVVVIFFVAVWRQSAMRPEAIAPIVVLVSIACFDHYLWSLWPGLALVALGMGMSVKLGKQL
ncbi:MAG: O-antigen ligase family protein [Candidatus Uhrbacteria bacterium]|nr:O-antigen ligase family protein [Candidatus Uhrbacteria bacterium]